jgi:hypothetical protein
MLQIPAKVMSVEYGDAPLMTTYGVSPVYVRMGSENRVQWITSAGMESRDYETMNARDGLFFSVGETVKCIFDNGENTKHSFSMGLTISHDGTDEKVYEYTSRAWMLGGDFTAPYWKGCRMYTRVTYSSSDYAGQEVLAPDKRKDTQTQFVLGLSQELFGNIGIDANHQFTRNSSTFGLYTYEKNLTTISISCAF